MKIAYLIAFLVIKLSVTAQIPSINMPHFKAKSTPIVLAGDTTYITAGTFSWVVPDGITSICAVCIGAGGRGNQVTTGAAGGGGGGLRYINNLPVTPGELLTIEVPSSPSTTGVPCRILRGANVLVYANSGAAGVYGGTGGSGSAFGDGPFGGTIGGGDGGNGGVGSVYSGYSCGGGGAAGYSGNGGDGGRISSGTYYPATNGSGGGGGGSAATSSTSGGGGGVGIYGEGSSGAAGTSGYQGGGGSGGGGGVYTTLGGNYGGGGGGCDTDYIPTRSIGGSGAVRILWGEGRAFPSTNVSNKNN